MENAPAHNAIGANLPIEVPAGGAAYLPGARLLAVLAHPPEAGKQRAWRETERAYCRICLAAQEDLTDGWATQPQNIVPDHLMMSQNDAEARAHHARKLLDHRMGAAHVIMPFLQVAESEGFSSRRGRHLMIDAQIQRTLRAEAERDDWLRSRGTNEPSRFAQSIDNFESRIVRTSLPVIHIAAAVAVAMDQLQKAFRNLSEADRAGLPSDFSGPQISFAHLLVYPKLALSIIRSSEGYEDLVARLPKLRPRPDSMVRLRVAED